jgi:hypothetical protein
MRNISESDTSNITFLNQDKPLIGDILPDDTPWGKKSSNE